MQSHLQLSFRAILVPLSTRPFTHRPQSVVHVWPAAEEARVSARQCRTETVNLTAAAKSICPPTAGGLPTPPPGLGFAAAPGRGAVGIGGFAPPTLGATAGLLPTGGGGPGFGFAATGGGPGLAAPTERVAAGVLSPDESAVEAWRFHGAAEPLPAAIPGNTATGFAEGSAAMDLRPPPPTLGAPGAAGAAGVGRLAAGGGGGGGGGGVAALGLGGTSSR